MSQPLKISLGGKNERLDVDTLIAALENTLEVLRNLGKQFSVPDDTIHWEITKARMGSPLTITVEPRATGRRATGIGEKIAKAAVHGLRLLEQEATPPPLFDEETLEAAKRLASIVREKGSKLKLVVPDEPPATPTEKTIQHITEIEEKARSFIDHATIEGKLEEVSVHETHHVNLWETLTNYKIECRVTPELLEQAKTILGRRVALTGELRYRNNRPRLMYVESIRILRDQKDLPQPQDIGPIDITGGKASEEYVRRLRDAE
jgi:hypothetical protein